MLVKLSLNIYCVSVAKTKEPEDEQLCIAVHAINICDVNPLDNSSIKAYQSSHCLTEHYGAVSNDGI